MSAGIDSASRIAACSPGYNFSMPTVAPLGFCCVEIHDGRLAAACTKVFLTILTHSCGQLASRSLPDAAKREQNSRCDPYDGN